MTSQRLPVLVALLLSACTVKVVDYTGKPCPCPDGYVCEPATNTCALSNHEVDAATPMIDAAPMPDSWLDLTSCLMGGPLNYPNPYYSTASFTDYPTGWTAPNGAWTPTGTDLAQTSTAAQLAYAFHSTTGMEQHIVTKFQQTAAGGQSIGIAFRVDPTTHSMYHCDWEPETGNLAIKGTDAGGVTTTLGSSAVNTSTIPGYTPQMKMTMEVGASNQMLACCLMGIGSAHVTVTDSAYTGHSVGVQTYSLAGQFRDFVAY